MHLSTEGAGGNGAKVLGSIPSTAKLFVVLACYYQVLDVFNQHLPATFHFPLLSNAVD